MLDFDRDETGSEGRYLSQFNRRRLWWLVHNCVAHPLIGLLPVRLFFRFHDWTSRKMHL